MRRIGITQRVLDLPDRSETWDCLDQAWTGLLHERGVIPVALPNTHPCIESLVEELGLDGLVLTGGNDLCNIEGAESSSEARDATEYRLINWCLAHDKGVVAVCRGMQLLVQKFGGSLSISADHVGQLHEVTPLEKGWSRGDAPFTVNSFHRTVVLASDVPSEFSVVVIASDGTAEAIRHKLYPISAMMWHPERKHGQSGWDEVWRSAFGSTSEDVS